MVIVAKVIKEHGNGNLVAGFENVKKHIENLRDFYRLPVVVAINKHADDSGEEILQLKNLCEDEKVDTVVCDAFGNGGKGCLDLAVEVLKKTNQKSTMRYCYELNDSVKKKIEKIAKNIYGAKKVVYSEKANEKIKLINKFDMSNYFVNIAKTQFSFSDDKSLLGAPKNFVFNVSDIEIRSGEKMIVAIAGNMLLMPALGKKSNYLNMKIDDQGKISGLF